MFVADISYRVKSQIPIFRYFQKTFEIANAEDLNKTKLQKRILEEENKIRNQYGDDLVELKVNFYC